MARMGRLAAKGRLATVFLALLLASCSLLFPRIKAPQLSIVGATLQKGDFWTQHIKLRVRVHNPNTRTLPVRGLRYTLDVDGERFAQGVCPTSFVVPAGGEAEFDTIVKVHLATTLIRLLGRRRDEPVPYHLHGRVRISWWLWRSVSFDHDGSFQPRDLINR